MWASQAVPLFVSLVQLNENLVPCNENCQSTLFREFDVICSQTAFCFQKCDTKLTEASSRCQSSRHGLLTSPRLPHPFPFAFASRRWPEAKQTSHTSLIGQTRSKNTPHWPDEKQKTNLNDSLNQNKPHTHTSDLTTPRPTQDTHKTLQTAAGLRTHTVTILTAVQYITYEGWCVKVWNDSL